MRSLFGGSPKPGTPSGLLESLSIPLVPHPARPAGLDAVPESAFGHCTPHRLAEAEFAELGQALDLAPVPDYYELSGIPGQGPLALVDQKLQGLTAWTLWEVKPGKKPALLRQRPMILASNQSEWTPPSLSDVVCLPEGRLLVGMSYFLKTSRRGQRHDLFLFDLATGKSRLVVEDAVSWAFGVPGKPELVKAQVIGPKAVLVLYRTGLIRLAPEVYTTQSDHLLLFTAQRPGGVEIAQVPREQGKIQDWGMSGRSLWLTTRVEGAEQAHQDRYWSLDLDRLL